MSPPSTEPVLRGVLMDLDGTLYPLKGMRGCMARELLWSAVIGSPLRGGRVIRSLRLFRRMREELRSLGCPSDSLEELQYTRPAGQLGMGASELKALVEDWMHRRPLRHLEGMGSPDLIPFLEGARAAGLQLGAFSDYPVGDKLDALGVRSYFQLEICATDPEVNAFKPHPAGFQHACRSWGMQPGEVLFVGDRDELDGVGARAAGMGVCILGGGQEASGGSAEVGELPDWTLPNLGALAQRLGFGRTR